MLNHTLLASSPSWFLGGGNPHPPILSYRRCVVRHCYGLGTKEPTHEPAHQQKSYMHQVFMQGQSNPQLGTGWGIMRYASDIYIFHL